MKVAQLNATAHLCVGWPLLRTLLQVHAAEISNHLSIPTAIQVYLSDTVEQHKMMQLCYQ